MACNLLIMSDGYSALFDPETRTDVTRYMLGFLDQFRLLWWSHRHFIYPPDRPRASWAIMMQIYRITDASDLVLEYLDADTIPSGIDVPMQRVRMADLGQLALTLGCTNVQIDVSARYFRAEGPHGIITTEQIPGFGTVAKYEGDIRAVSQIEVWKCNQESIALAMEMTLGKFLVGKYFVRGLIDLNFIYHAITENLSQTDFFEISERQAALIDFQSKFTPGHCVQEGEQLSLCFEALSKPALVCSHCQGSSYYFNIKDTLSLLQKSKRLGKTKTNPAGKAQFAEEETTPFKVLLLQVKMRNYLLNQYSVWWHLPPGNTRCSSLFQLFSR
jgi:hypothetical protein